MGGKNILIVDNSPVFLSLLGNFLRKQGYHVSTAEDGLGALAVIQHFKPDIIFIDFVMPGIDGGKLCRKFREIPELKDVTIALISALALELNLQHADSGFDACIAKGPFRQMSQQIQRFIEQQGSKTILASPQKEIKIGFEHVHHREITTELLSVQEHLESILSNISEGIIETREDSKIAFVNPAAIEIIGKTELELIGSSFIELFLESEWKTISENLKTDPTKSDGMKVLEFSLDNKKTVSLKSLPIGNRNSRVIVMSDITVRKKAEIALNYHTDFEKLITEILARFVNLPADEVDSGIREALGKIGSFSGVDRSYVFLFSENGKRVDNTHEWCAPGIIPQIENLQAIDLESSVPWFAKIIKNREVFLVSNLDDLPEEAKAERKEFRREGIRSIINVPIISGGSLVGFLGLDSVTAEKQWPMEVIPLLKIMGEVIANALHRSYTDKAVRESEKKFRELADLLPQIIFEVDLKGNFTFINRRATDFFGPATPGDLNSLRYIAPEFRSRAIKHFRRVLKGEDLPAPEFDYVNEDGIRVSLVVHSLPVIQEGKTVGLRGVAVDITERKQTEQQLKYMSSHDTLTGLYNRGYFEEELRRLENGRRFPVNILMADVDGLKEINDTLGHSAGDELIRRAAGVLAVAFRSEDVVARLGGDEFAAVWTGSTEGDSQSIRNRIERCLAKHNMDHVAIPLKLSIGTASGGQGSRCGELLKEADQRMYSQKMLRKSLGSEKIRAISDYNSRSESQGQSPEI